MRLYLAKTHITTRSEPGCFVGHRWFGPLTVLATVESADPQVFGSPAGDNKCVRFTYPCLPVGLCLKP